MAKNSHQHSTESRLWQALRRLPDPASHPKTSHPSWEVIAQYLDKNLSEQETHSFIEHLVRCSLCREVVAATAPILNVSPLATTPPSLRAVELLNKAEHIGRKILSAVVSLSATAIHILDTDAEVQFQLAKVTRNSAPNSINQGISFHRRFQGREVEVFLGGLPNQKFNLRLNVTPLSNQAGKVHLYRGSREIAVTPFRMGGVTFKSLKAAHYTLSVEEAGCILGHLNLQLEDEMSNGTL